MGKTLIEVANVKGLGKIVEIRDNFYNQILQFNKEGVIPISPREEAYIRIKTIGKEKIGRVSGTRTSAGFEYIAGELPILNLNSRLLNPKLARLAVKANAKEEDFFTDPDIYYKDLEKAHKDERKDPKDRNIFVIPLDDNLSEPTTISEKENWEIYESIFKDMAKPYFELHGPIKIQVPYNRDFSSRKRTILTQLWFDALSNLSHLTIGRNIDFNVLKYLSRFNIEPPSLWGCMSDLNKNYSFRGIKKFVKK